MTNLERWENFFKRKKWKFKKFQLKNGEDRILFKTYHRSMRCHMFISETRLNFCFYKGYKLPRSTGVDKVQFGKQTQYCLVKRYGTLNIFHKPRTHSHVHNLALAGPATLMTQMMSVIKLTTKLYNKYGDEVKQKTLYSCGSRNKMFSTLEFFLQLNGLKPPKLWRKALNDVLPRVYIKELLICCYPSLVNFPFKPTNRTSFILRKPGLGLHEICKKIFGHKSKLLVKSLEYKDGRSEVTSTSRMDLGILLKSKLNRGEMEQVILQERLDPVDFNKHDFLVTRKFIRKFTSKQLVHLFTQEYRGYYLRDAARQWAEYPTKIIIPEKVQNWKHIHDDISRQYLKLGQADYEFNIKPALKKIDGVEVDGHVIILPKTRHELIDWGTKMNNCIAGYHSQFNQGHTILLGIKEGNELKYNVEIQGGVIRQFMANRNCWAGEEVVNRFKQVFKDHKLIGG